MIAPNNPICQTRAPLTKYTIMAAVNRIATVDVAGCLKSRIHTSRTSPVIGSVPRKKSLLRCPCPASHAARYKMTVSFANSAGWNVTGPRWSQRSAPPALNPSGVNTSARNTTLIASRIMAIFWNRR